MKTYICKEDLLDEINEKIGYMNYCSPYQNDNDLIVNGLERARDSIEDAEPADVAEVKHGKWHDVYQVSSWCSIGHCSACSKRSVLPISGGTPYCSKCGAQMDGDKYE